MDFPYLPKKLVTVCSGIIKGRVTHPAYPSLMRTLSETDTLTFILVHDDLRSLLGGARAARRLGTMCYLGCAVLFVAGLLISLWITAGIPVVLAIGFFLRRKARQMDITLCAILMSLELVANDFGEASRYLPDAYNEARAKIEKYLPNHARRVLDLYMPGVDGSEGEEFRTGLIQFFEIESRRQAGAID